MVASLEYTSWKVYVHESGTLSRGDHLYIEYKGELEGRWSCDKPGKSVNAVQSSVLKAF